jgi:aspartyl-tRNA(Asn)/glutamyl-tRNA(Gln) amidotransferase subunit A
VVPFAPPVTRHDVERQFREIAESRGDVRPNPRAPAPTAAALYQYFDRHGGDAEDRVRHGFEVYRIFYDVLPERWEEMHALLRHAPAEDPAGASFARSRATLNARLAEAFREHQLDAMIYPTMPFPAPRAVDDWPDIRTPLGYGNWLGIPEVSVPSGYGTDGMPGGNLSFVGVPGSDARLLALAHSYEQASQRFRPPPLPA